MKTKSNNDNQAYYYIDYKYNGSHRICAGIILIDDKTVNVKVLTKKDKISKAHIKKNIKKVLSDHDYDLLALFKKNLDTWAANQIVPGSKTKISPFFITTNTYEHPFWELMKKVVSNRFEMPFGGNTYRRTLTQIFNSSVGSLLDAED